MSPQDLERVSGIRGIPNTHQVVVSPAGQTTTIRWPLQTTHFMVVGLRHGNNVFWLAYIMMMYATISTTTAKSQTHTINHSTNALTSTTEHIVTAHLVRLCLFQASTPTRSVWPFKSRSLLFFSTSQRWIPELLPPTARYLPFPAHETEDTYSSSPGKSTNSFTDPLEAFHKYTVAPNPIASKLFLDQSRVFKSEKSVIQVYCNSY